MLPQASFASSSRSVPTMSTLQHYRPGPNPLTHQRRMGFSMESIKIPTAPNPATEEQTTLDNPVRTMFIRYQARLIEQGKQRLSYPREYKLAAIELVKAGKSRYRKL